MDFTIRRGVLAALAVAAVQFGRETAAQAVVESDTFFYGDSPPVYPSPDGTGLGNWAEAYSKAKAIVAQLTLAEKVNLTAGVSSSTLCSGAIPAIAHVGFPGLCLSDAENGLRSTDFVSAWASGISVGASWNRDLTHQRAIGMAGEFRAKGVNVALGPVVGPIGRVAKGGRNWEGFASDPYLSGALAYETVLGMQSVGVATSTKHYIGNEQETDRNPSGNVSAVSSNIDDQTLHELYLWPFQDAIFAGTSNIMCSYNRVNNSYACANSKLLNGVLKTELGFQGFVVSDWAAQHAGVATALAGLDMAMPASQTLWDSYLVEAVTNGSVPESRVDDMAVRILASWYQLGQDQIDEFREPGFGMPASVVAPHQAVIGRRLANQPILQQCAVEGHVLVKNTNGALPFHKDQAQLISVFGYGARTPETFQPATPADSTANGWNLGLYGNVGSNLPSLPGVAAGGVLIGGGGSGANEPAYISSPLDALTQRARRDGTSLYWDVNPSNPYPSAVDPASYACIVVGNALATEGSDRSALYDNYTDGLVLAVAGNCSNTVVVLHNAGMRLVDQFADHPNVTAIIFAHLPGQDAGEALVDILYGDVNPSGKLPYTVPRNESDLGTLQSPDQAEGQYTLFPQSDFSEGVFIDYRAFDKNGVTPRYAFGFGLSYTTFGFSSLEVEVGGASYKRDSSSSSSPRSSSGSPAEYPSGEIIEGGQADLWEVLVTVTVQLSNTGSVAGAEVAQLYLGNPESGQPVRQLRGFEKVGLQPGESATVTFYLKRRDLSVWDTTAQKWRLSLGKAYTIYVGSSSSASDLPLQGTFTL